MFAPLWTLGDVCGGLMRWRSLDEPGHSQDKKPVFTKKRIVDFGSPDLDNVTLSVTVVV